MQKPKHNGHIPANYGMGQGCERGGGGGGWIKKSFGLFQLVYFTFLIYDYIKCNWIKTEVFYR